MLSATAEWDEVTHVWEDVVTEPTRVIYSAYKRQLGIGAKPAVVAIDLYNMVFAGGDRPPHELQNQHPSSCGKYAYAAIAPIKKVFAQARALDIPVIHITLPAQGRVLTATNRQSLSADQQARDFYPGLGPVGTEMVIEKERASAFYGTQLVAELVSQGINTVVVVGESTSGCVRASVVDGYSNGFHMVTVENGVFDRSWLNHQVNLFDLHHKYADGLDADIVVQLFAAVCERGV